MLRLALVAFFALFILAHGCYTGAGFQLVDCGQIGESTRITTLLVPQHRHDIIAFWGDGVTPDAYYETLTSINDSTEEKEVVLDHVYTAAGNYQIRFETKVFSNASDDSNSSCIAYDTAANYEWTLNVQSDSCTESRMWSYGSSGQFYSLVVVVVVTAVLSVQILFL